MKAAVDEAHKMAKKAIAHANGPEAIKKAVKAGVDSIVHGFYINEECAELMVEKNVILEPTTLVIKQIVDHVNGEMLDTLETKANAYWEIKKKEFKMIFQKGVAISFSSDAGCLYMYHGENAKELAMCVELGMSPMGAIVSATKTASCAIGMEDEIGTIEKGKLADIVIVNGGGPL